MDRSFLREKMTHTPRERVLGEVLGERKIKIARDKSGYAQNLGNPSSVLHYTAALPHCIVGSNELVQIVGRFCENHALAEASGPQLGDQDVQLVEALFDQISPFLFRLYVIAAFLFLSQILAWRFIGDGDGRSSSFPPGLYGGHALQPWISRDAPRPVVRLRAIVIFRGIKPSFSRT